MSTELLGKLTHRIAQLAVGRSALRNQGAPGLVEVARRFFEEVDLESFVVNDQEQFLEALNRATRTLQHRFPVGGRNWGAARKGLNLFLRDVLYSSYLSEGYGFPRIRPWLEVPLDRYVARGLTHRMPEENLPRWPGIKHLQPDQNAQYQKVAGLVARAFRVARVDLDLWYGPTGSS